MPKKDPRTPEFAPQSLDALRSRMRPSSALAPAPLPDVPEVGLIVRYLNRALIPQDVDAVQKRANHDPAFRDQMDAVLTLLEEIEALPEEALRARTAEPGVVGQVTREWLALQSEREGTPERVRAWLHAHGWADIWQKVLQGGKEIPAAFIEAHGELRRAADRWRAAWGAPLTAPARGGDPASASGQSASIASAEITEEGDLRITLAAASMPQSQVGASSGRAARLVWRTPGEIWPLDAVVLEPGQTEWILPEFGTLLGLPTGPVPTESLDVFMDEPDAP